MLSGCTSTYYATNVDSLAAPDATQKNRYILLPGMEEVHEDDLQFMEFAKYVNKILQQKGFIKAPSSDSADIAIALSYSVGDPEFYNYSYTVPTWGQTGVAASNTVGTVSAFGNTATYSGTTTYTPTYGITGSQTHTGTDILYYRDVRLAAYDLTSYSESQPMRQVWISKAYSVGSSGDLRKVFPYILVSMKNLIATNSGKKIRVTLKENDKAVQELLTP